MLLFFFKKNLNLLKKIYSNYGKSDIYVKNGYATLCDDVFIIDTLINTEFAIPVVKASTGKIKKIIFPYDKKAKLLPLKILQQDSILYEYLKSNRDKLDKRKNDKSTDTNWYAFGRSQALLDTFKNKITMNTLIRNENDLKFVHAPSGTGVYSGLYITSETVPFHD